MLSVPKTSDRDRNGDKKDAGRDSSADFIQELAEAGTASELDTVKAASDAVDGKDGKAAERRRRPETNRSAKE